MLKKCFLLAFGAVTIATAAKASSFDGRPKILLHLTHPTTKGILCERGRITDCREAMINADLYPNGKSYFLYVEVHQGDDDAGLGSWRRLAGVQFSVDYDAAPGSGVDIFTWTYCTDLHFSADGVNGPWPSPLSSNLLTWDPYNNCQNDEVAIVGYFYLAAYSPDVVRVLPRVVDGQSKLADCAGSEFLLHGADLGRVAFSSAAATPGCNPCVENCITLSPRGNPLPPASVPVLVTTWSSLKNLYP